jgi:hypothetical protein
VKLSDISGEKGISKNKIVRLESNSKLNNLGNCIGASVTLRRVTGIELM